MAPMFVYPDAQPYLLELVNLPVKLSSINNNMISRMIVSNTMAKITGVGNLVDYKA